MPSKTPASEYIQKKREELGLLKKSVTEMREHIQEQKEERFRERAKENITFWMDNVVFPFLEGIAAGFNEPLIPGIQRLIKEGKNPFRPRDNGWDRTQETQLALNSFLSQPQTKVIQVLARPYLRRNMDWINKEAKWIREEILKTAYPDVYSAIIDTQGGQEWLDELIHDLTAYLRRMV